MPCARCSMCGHNFPVARAGEECPICEGDTLAGFLDDEPDEPEALQRAINWAEFERQYGPAEVT